MSTIRLFSNGRTNDPASADSWTLQGGELDLRWPRAGAPGGAWLDECALSFDARAYGCRNQNGTPVIGSRVYERFIRGDANQDGSVDIADALFTLLFLFGDARPIYCTKALDADDDGRLGVADAIYTVKYLFTDGPAIPLPRPPGGFDGTADGLGC